MEKAIVRNLYFEETAIECWDVGSFTYENLRALSSGLNREVSVSVKDNKIKGFIHCGDSMPMEFVYDSRILYDRENDVVLVLTPGQIQDGPLRARQSMDFSQEVMYYRFSFDKQLEFLAYFFIDTNGITDVQAIRSLDGRFVIAYQYFGVRAVVTVGEGDYAIRWIDGGEPTIYSEEEFEKKFVPLDYKKDL